MIFNPKPKFWFWEPCANAMLVVSLVSQPFRQRKKLLVDVANLATCCHDDYDVLLEVLGTLRKCYVSNPVAKTLVWIENHDWHNCFWMSSWGSPLLDPKKLQNQQF